MDIEQRKRHHLINLNDAAQLCVQNKDIAINIFTCAAGKLKDRCCNITGNLEKLHCRGYMPYPMLGEACGFIGIFYNLLNEKLNEPKDYSMSFLDSAFSSKCKIAENTCLKDNNDSPCTDSNENLLRNVLFNYLESDLEIPNLRMPYIPRYCYFLKKQHDYLLTEYHKIRNQMEEINNLNTEAVFVIPGEEANGSYKLNPTLPSDIKIPSSKASSFIDDKIIREQMETKKLFTDIKLSFMEKMEKADEKSLTFVSKYLIQYIPHMIHVQQTANRKALYVFQKFYNYSIWILAFGMLTTLAEQLKDDMAPCTYKNFVVASISDKNQRKECKKQS